jgi:hypothetical protein
MTEKIMSDERALRRSLQYQFFNHKSADHLEQLKAAIAENLISPEMLEMIPLGFWTGVLDQTEDCPRCMTRLADRLGYDIQPKSE